MVNLLYTEFLKLKRSYMFLISIIGAAVTPFVVVIGASITQDKVTEPVLFDELFYQTNLYTILVIGVPLYGVVTAYLFNREYAEDTLKNLLTIPVSRMNFLLSKCILLFMWIMVLAFVSWSLTFIFGLLGQFDGLSNSLFVESFQKAMVGGVLSFILISPIMLFAIVTKNYVPPIILSILATLLNVMSGQSEHRDLFPWAAAGDIANKTMLATYPPEYSYIVIAATSLIGFIGTIVYFNKVDIH